MLRLVLLLFLSSTLQLLAAEVVKFGSYSSDMTLEQAKQISGGHIECIPVATRLAIKTCTLTTITDEFEFRMVKTAEGLTTSMDYAEVIPETISQTALFKQTAEEFEGFGQPRIKGSSLFFDDSKQTFEVRIVNNDEYVLSGKRHVFMKWTNLKTQNGKRLGK